jgi:hypothetical protein
VPFGVDLASYTRNALEAVAFEEAVIDMALDQPEIPENCSVVHKWGLYQSPFINYLHLLFKN